MTCLLLTLAIIFNSPLLATKGHHTEVAEARMSFSISSSEFPAGGEITKKLTCS